MTKKQWLLPILIFIMSAQTACANPDAPTTPAPSTDNCPTATADLKLLTNAEDGYCLLYPADYSTDLSHYIVINRIAGPGDIPGDAWMSIYTEPAKGRTAAEIANAAMDEVRNFSLDFNLSSSEILIDGKQAFVLDGLPGQDSNRQVIVVGNDRLYTLMFAPWYPNVNSSILLENLYTTIVQTLHFLSPE